MKSESALAGKKPIGKNRKNKKGGISGVLPTDYNADAFMAKVIDSWSSSNK